MSEGLAGVRVIGPDVLRRTVGFEALIDPVATALADYSRGLGEAPVAFMAPGGRDGDVHVKSAWLADRRLFTVKVGTWFAAGDPPGGGLIAAFDARSGRLRALLQDEHHLSDVRTAAAGAVAAGRLARRDSQMIGVLGSGVQAYLQALAAAHALPAVRAIRLWGRSAGRAAQACRALARRRPDLQVEAVSEPRLAVAEADVVITATASREPILRPDWLRPGVHVTALGSDDADKCELDPMVLGRADRIIVDSRPLCCAAGEVRRALAAQIIQPTAIDAELGELVAGRGRGRRRPSEVTVAKLVGVGVQDLAAVETALALLDEGGAPPAPPASALDLAVAGAAQPASAAS